MATARRPLRLSFAGLPDAPARHLSVDGMTPAGPNLSHWPGNRTPEAWKADLSTGICLRFARAPAAEQEAFLGGAEAVLNDHYDTDGFLSLLAVLHPDVALAREEVCLAAAATGDFQAFQTRRAFAIDRIVKNLPWHAASPAALGPVEGAARSHAAYQWLLAHAGEILDAPMQWAPLFSDELAQVEAELNAVRRGAAQRRFLPRAQLAVVRSPGPLHRMVLNTCAAAYRVLHVIEAEGAPHYRYHDRTESWFELATFTPPARRDLAPLRARLEGLENAVGGRGSDTAAWCADPPSEPVPELYFGDPAPQEYGEVTRTLRPSRLPPDLVEREVAAFFTDA